MTKPTPYYYPFGSLIPNRSWSDASREYRYGFNGKEKDFETASDNYDFGDRLCDSRLSRWLSFDKLFHMLPFHSGYCLMGNSPMVFIDIKGNIIIPIKSFCDNFESLYDKVHKNSFLRKYSKNTIIILTAKDIGDEGIAATVHVGHTSCNFHVIQFNTIGYKKHADQTHFLATLLHEYMHVYLNIKVNDIKKRLDKGKGINQDQQVIYSFYMLYNGNDNFNTWTHEYMAVFLRSDLISSMKEQDIRDKKTTREGAFVDENGELVNFTTEDWYEAMSWNGLTDTNAWRNLDSQKRKLFSKIISQERDANTVVNSTNDIKITPQKEKKKK